MDPRKQQQQAKSVYVKDGQRMRSSAMKAEEKHLGKLMSTSYASQMETKFVIKHHRKIFWLGLAMASTIPFYIYNVTIKDMQKLERGALDDIQRVYSKGKGVSMIPKKKDQ